MILLDTNAVLWAVNGDRLLGEKARRTLQAGCELGLSTMVIWEIALLATRGRITLLPSLDWWFDRARELLKFTEIPVTGSIAGGAGTMEGLHGDPGDRIIIATARSLDRPLLTSDRKTLAYAAAGHLKAVDARV